MRLLSARPIDLGPEIRPQPQEPRHWPGAGGAGNWSTPDPGHAKASGSGNRAIPCMPSIRAGALDWFQGSGRSTSPSPSAPRPMPRFLRAVADFRVEIGLAFATAGNTSPTSLIIRANRELM